MYKVWQSTCLSWSSLGQILSLIISLSFFNNFMDVIVDVTNDYQRSLENSNSHLDENTASVTVSFNENDNTLKLWLSTTPQRTIKPWWTYVWCVYCTLSIEPPILSDHSLFMDKNLSGHTAHAAYSNIIKWQWKNFDIDAFQHNFLILGSVPHEYSMSSNYFTCYNDVLHELLDKTCIK